MPLNAKKGILTASTVNGATDTVNLPAGFDLKALILFTAAATAEGDVDGHGILSCGFATKDGGSIQQGCVTLLDTDAVATSDGIRGMRTTAALVGFSNAVPTQDFELDVTTLDTEQFVVTWTDAPAAAIKVHYLALGGDAITGARVHSFVTDGAATQDVTVNAGFGQPDLLLFLSHMSTDSNTDGNATNAGIMLGAAKSATERRVCTFNNSDAQPTMTVSQYHGDKAMALHTTATLNMEIELADRGVWPVDGFRMLKSPAATGRPTIGLALKGTFTATIDNGTIPTAAAPQTTTHAIAAETPQAAILFGGSSVATAGLTTAGNPAGDFGGFFLGATDGIDEGSVGICQDDAAADSYTGRFHSESKAYRTIVTNAGAPAVQSEADAALTPTALELTWTDTDAAARDFSYVLLGAQSDITGPTVAITAPLDGATVSGTIALEATASDPSDVQSVQWTVDGVDYEAPDTTDPYTTTFDTTTLPDGPITIAITALDTLGNSATTSVDVTIQNDVTGPTVTINTPTEGADVGSSLSASGTATDPSGLANEIRYFIDGVQVATDSPYSPWNVAGIDVSALSNGPHTFRVEAEDSLGNVGFDEVGIVVNNDVTGPNVTIDTPLPNQVYEPGSGPTVTGTLTDASSITQIRLLVDGVVLEVKGGDTPYNFNSFDVDALAAGLHTIVVEATDEHDNVGTASRTFTVDLSGVRPVVSEFAEDLYSRLGPWQRADGPDNDWALLHMCEAIGSLAQKIEDVIRDRDG